MGADAGRAFGLDEPAAVRVRDTGALPHGEARPLRGDVRRGPRPELAVRNVARAQDLQRIDRRVAGAARLRIDHHAVGVGQLAERFVVVVQNTVAHRAAHVLQEAVRDLRTLHHPPGHHGQVTPQVVAAETAELLRETLRPIDETHLPTVGQQEPDAVAGLLRRADQRQQHAVAVEREGFRVEVIERKTLPAIARRRGARPGAGPGVADHGPLPFRSVPYEFPPVETGGDVENLLPAERLGPPHRDRNPRSAARAGKSPEIPTRCKTPSRTSAEWPHPSSGLPPALFARPVRRCPGRRTTWEAAAVRPRPARRPGRPSRSRSAASRARSGVTNGPPGFHPLVALTLSVMPSRSASRTAWRYSLFHPSERNTSPGPGLAVTGLNPPASISDAEPYPLWPSSPPDRA